MEHPQPSKNEAPLPDFLEIRSSAIHGRGIYATQTIPRGKKLLEYVGERITKRMAEQRAAEQQGRASREEGAVYIFEVNSRYDIDGNVPWNPARLINHSCETNCKAYKENGRIFIYSTRRIQPGEELKFNYGYDVENALDHPCRCGSERCVGYIVRPEQRRRLRRLLAKKDAL